MIETWAARLVGAVGVYCALGVIFAIAFVARGARRIDPAMSGSTWGVRVLILPGVVALWPWLAHRWVRGGGAPPGERNAHRDAAGGRV